MTPALPTISVVIASYNHAAFVQESLRSVLEQQHVDLEIVVTDDGSSDDTAERVRSLADPRIRLEAFASNRGACIALNHGISRARGEFIAILNSDDCFEPGKLALQLDFLRANPQVGAVFGWPSLMDERGQVFSDAQHKDFEVFHVANRDRFAWLRHFFDHGNCLCHPTVLIRRTCYEALGLYDARLAQVPDLDMWVRLAMRFGIHVMPQPLTRFRIRDGLQNASAARPDVVVRDARERRHVLRRFLALTPAECALVFPEFAASGQGVTRFLAERALRSDLPFFRDFALDALHESLSPLGDPQHPQDHRDYHALAGRLDLYRIYP